ncbi:hypothetical protein BLNAU_9349 [Blattamonas nauphoetae]|uniref:Uncharacterized protein n=1 Tax=Blattamonas nauphoetae TaxID=2049346 RepID=A0ABQ9XW13_9EUKA|nr:hypothetical protein BLNAU_9349 [Blattamonas nauphoetae]
MKTAHRLTPTTLTQIVDTPEGHPWRTAFTQPIYEGEWELKIRASDSTFVNVMFGFLGYPLPEDATHNMCSAWTNPIGGDFVLWKGNMWASRIEIVPAGTNKKCDTVGQIAAIRVNMRTREARLFVDDVEQPRFFINIPSPLCLAITTGGSDKSVEVMWLKRLRSTMDVTIQAENFEKAYSLKA